MASRSPSRTSSSRSFPATSQLAFAVRLPRNQLPWSFSPLRRSHSRNPLPSLASFSRCHPLHLALLRRGVPIPLRSAFAVSHDPDGFLLLEPCGIFHPLTPVGFWFPVFPPSADQPPHPKGMVLLSVVGPEKALRLPPARSGSGYLCEILPSPSQLCFPDPQPRGGIAEAFLSLRILPLPQNLKGITALPTKVDFPVTDPLSSCGIQSATTQPRVLLHDSLDGPGHPSPTTRTASCSSPSTYPCLGFTFLAQCRSFS